MLSQDQQELTNRVLKLYENSIAATEAMNTRLDILTVKIEKIDHYVHGNGEAGLGEQVRNLQTAINDLKELKDFKTDYKTTQEKVNNLSKMVWGLWGALVTLVGTLLGRVLWTYIGDNEKSST